MICPRRSIETAIGVQYYDLMSKPPTIFLLTDFGTTDHYVAVMKAVILSRCPQAVLVDITHQVPPQSVEAGAYLLESTWPWLPADSVTLAVVDPGVGSGREAAVFSYRHKCIIGPNNGLMSFLPEGTHGRILDKPEFWLENVSPTFHGRDIFAPCAAFVAAGGHWTQLGDKPAKPRLLLPEAASSAGSAVQGRIIYFDHFGTAITSIRSSDERISGAASLEIPGQLRCPVMRTYSDVAPGQALAYPGSSGRLEIAARNGSARQQLNLQLNDTIYLEPGASNL
jgi:S-adenosylmethionine hydrolase